MLSNDLAIRVENVSKQYRIGGSAFVDYMGMHGLAEKIIRAPFRLLRNGTSRSMDPTHVPSWGARYIWALKEISFEVKMGEVLGLIGPNGAGKSVLLKILSRITKPTEGYAQVRGKVGSMLEAGAGFHPELTGRENIFLSGAILGMTQKEIARKFDEIAAFSGVELFLDTPIKRYSSGMNLRLAFSVAAHLDSEIMLIDEVLAVGDEGFKQQCLKKMRSVASKGRTVIFVSHDMDIVKKLCDRALLLQSGKLVMNDITEHVITHYLSEIGEMRRGGGRVGMS